MITLRIKRFSDTDNYVISRRSTIDRKPRVPKLAKTLKSAKKTYEESKNNLEAPILFGPYPKVGAENKFNIERIKYANTRN